MWLDRVSQTLTIVVTNCIKLGGLYVGVHTIVTTHGVPDPVELAYSALLVAGGQVSERAVIAFLDRFFGRGR